MPHPSSLIFSSRSLAARLTLWYTASAFLLIFLVTVFLYWVLNSNLDREDDQYLADKVRSPAYPKDLRQRAVVNAVMDWANTGFYRTFGYGLCYPQVLDGLREVERARRKPVQQEHRCGCRVDAGLVEDPDRAIGGRDRAPPRAPPVDGASGGSGAGGAHGRESTPAIARRQSLPSFRRPSPASDRRRYPRT